MLWLFHKISKYYTLANISWHEKRLSHVQRLQFTHLHYVRVGSALVGFVVLCVFQQHFVHVRAGVLKQLVRAVENDEGYLTVT